MPRPASPPRRCLTAISGAVIAIAAAIAAGMAADARAQDIGSIVTAYRTSVFKVYAGTDPIGTATLIDQRGYFLTASHVTEAAPGYDSDRPRPYSKPLTLRNPYLNLVLTGREIWHASPWQQLDVSIIHVDVTKSEHTAVTRLAPVEPVITPPGAIGLAGNVGMLGYKLADTALQYHGFVPVGTVPVAAERSTHFVIAMGSAFHGQSGSLAINADARAVGILHGPPDPMDPNPREMKFTRIYSAISFLQELPPSENIRRLLAAMAQSSLDEGSKLMLLNCSFTSLDILALVAEVQRNMARYRDGLKKHFREFRDCMFARAFIDQLAWFAHHFYTEEARLPSTEIIDTARMLHKTWQSITTAGLTTGQESTMLASAVKLYEAGLAAKFPAAAQPARDAYLSNAFYDLALAYRDRGGLDADAQPRLDRALHASIAYNPYNFKSFFLASQAFTVRGETDVAKLAAANASAIARREAERVMHGNQNLADYLTAFSAQVDEGLTDKAGRDAKITAAKPLGSLSIANMVKTQLQH